LGEFDEVSVSALIKANGNEILIKTDTNLDIILGGHFSYLQFFRLDWGSRDITALAILKLD